MAKRYVWNYESIQNLHDLARFGFSAKEIATLLGIARDLRESEECTLDDGKILTFWIGKVETLKKIFESHKGVSYFIAKHDDSTPLYVFLDAKAKGVDMEKACRKVATPVLV